MWAQEVGGWRRLSGSFVARSKSTTIVLHAAVILRAGSLSTLFEHLSNGVSFGSSQAGESASFDHVAVAVESHGHADAHAASEVVAPPSSPTATHLTLVTLNYL